MICRSEQRTHGTERRRSVLFCAMIGEVDDVARNLVKDRGLRGLLLNQCRVAFFKPSPLCLLALTRCSPADDEKSDDAGEDRNDTEHIILRS